MCETRNERKYECGLLFLSMMKGETGRSNYAQLVIRLLGQCIVFI